MNSKLEQEQQQHHKHLSGKRAADLPMMPVRIDHSPHAPAVSFVYRMDLRRTGLHRSREDSIRISDRQDHSNRAATKRLRAEVSMLWRFVTRPKFRALHGKSCHHAALGSIQAKDLSGPEG